MQAMSYGEHKSRLYTRTIKVCVVNSSNLQNANSNVSHEYVHHYLEIDLSDTGMRLVSTDTTAWSFLYWRRPSSPRWGLRISPHTFDVSR